MDNRLNEMSKKFEEQTTSINTQLQQNQRNQNQSQRGSQNYRGQNYRGNRGNYRGRSRGNNRGFQGPRHNQPRQPWQNNYGRNYNPQNQNNQNQNWQNQTANQNNNQDSQQQWRNPNPNFNNNDNYNDSQPTFEVFTPDPNYMPYTQQSSITCHKCGYPNHLAPNCTMKGPPPRRGAQNPFNQDQKN